MKTVAEFLEAFAKVAHEFTLVDYDGRRYIRTKEKHIRYTTDTIKTEVCPIERLAAVYPVDIERFSLVQMSIEALGLDKQAIGLADDIIKAADDYCNLTDQGLELREGMLKAMNIDVIIKIANEVQDEVKG